MAEMDDFISDAPDVLYDCCEHCDIGADDHVEGLDEHQDPCPEGCNDEGA